MEIYPIRSVDEAKDLFMEINQAQPVQAMDLPGGSDGDVKEAINEACDALYDAHKPMFSSSLRCRPPHLNLDKLRQSIHDNELFEMVRSSSNGSADGVSLLRWMEAKNEQLGARDDSAWIKVGGKGPGFAKALKKARKHSFYLGLAPDEWLRQ